MQDLVVVYAVLVQQPALDQFVDDPGRRSRVVEEATILEGTDGGAVDLNNWFRRDHLKIKHHRAWNERDSAPMQDAHDVLPLHSSE